MKRVPNKVLAVASGLVLFLASCSSNELAMPEFEKLPSFQGRVTKVEKIPYAPDYILHSASGPDFRVTVTRADGSTLIIKRIHTQVFGDDRLKKLVNKGICNLPDEIAACEDRIGKDNY
jgi:hypothetical protein